MSKRKKSPSDTGIAVGNPLGDSSMARVRPVRAGTDASETVVLSTRAEATHTSLDSKESHDHRLLAGEPLPPGMMAGPYRLGELIGAGGCGIVFAAEHASLGHRVAIKVMRRRLAASAEAVQRFAREARLIGRIRHPNIVGIYDIGVLDDERPYQVMEFVDGKSLSAMLRDIGRLSPLEALELLEPVCDALQAAHDIGIIHRDVKPSNILVVESRAQRRVKLLDFGIAKLMTPPEHTSSTATTLGRMLGSPTGMSPEQVIGGPVDARTDVYSLGVLTYQLVTGQRPFSGPDPHSICRQHLHAPVPAASQFAPVPRALDAIIERCMQKNPAHRFSSVALVLDALRDALGVAQSLPRAEVPAVALYVQANVTGGEADDWDDGLLDDIIALIDEADQAFERDDLVVAHRTEAQILGVRLSTDDPTSRDSILDLARSLWTDIALRVDPDSLIRVSLCIHVGGVTVDAADGSSMLHGPLLDIGSWAPLGELHGVYATPAALEQLMPENSSQDSRGGFVKIVVDS